MSMVIYGLCCAVVFLLVVIGAMAFGHRQELARERRAHARTERRRLDACEYVIDTDWRISTQIALERENAHLRAQLAETWGDPPTQLNLPQPEPEQMGLTWDTKAADGLACPEPVEGEDQS